MDYSVDGIPQLASQGSACTVGIDHIFEHTRGVFTHGRPEIADDESLLSKRPAFSVIFTFAVVYFVENLERLQALNAIEMRPVVSSADPKLASASVCAFSARGTCWMVKVGNAFNSSWTLSRYKIILGWFAMYSPEA
ncbi:hypothetical protein L3X38_018140 [Prunus dulcis]|uniref:Uncharacterized protein n=1 Tax=Prunus dulcis TaxID=3755 RepID=A0AAD4W8M9_PRUDU|nr:hypothetical protein L3X38_018140 [Prunus dulcis]